MDKYAGGAISNICGSVLYNGEKSVTEIKSAINYIFKINDALRIRVNESNEEISQEIVDYSEQDFEVYYFYTKSELDEFGDQYAKQPIDISGSLCEVKIIYVENKYGLIIKMHHLIGDAWTLALLCSQFNKKLNDEFIETYSYLEHLEQEEKYISSKRYFKDKDFFLKQFKKCEETTYFSEKTAYSFKSKRKTFLIGKSRTRLLNDYCNKNELSLFSLFTTALGIYFSVTHMNTEHFYMGTVILNRTTHKEKNTVGMFINTIPVLIELKNKDSFSINSENIQNNLFSFLKHQKYNYEDFHSDIRKEYSFTEKMYDVILSYQNAQIICNEQNFETTWYHCGMQTESLQIHIDDRDKQGILKINYDYLCDCFSEDEINLLHQHTLNLLFTAIEDDSQKLYELNFLTESEKQKLFFKFNDTSVIYPRDKCVHQLLEEQVEKTPDKVAVITSDVTLTYAEINEEANKIAHSLITEGIIAGDIVAFILPRKSYLLSTMFGILKSGATYLPIDPDYPKDRIEYMLSDSKAKICITEDNISEFIHNEKTENPNISVCSGKGCYCIYTSGSTGKPKGTLVTHKNVVNYVNNNNNNVVHKIIKEDYKTILSITTVGFDIFVTESLLPLTNGLEILLANEQQAKLQSELNELICKFPIDVLQTTPTKMKSLIVDKSQLVYLENIKTIILGGEALDKALVEKLQSITGAKIYNIYGPTEATVWITNANIVDAADITIGKPVANTQIYIVDKYMKPTPIGVTGELCVAGDCVCAGYLNRPELTTEKFIDNPFGDGKLYKTGDLAYWREDGNIAYVGRNDFQVKIRGLRIELGEIENTISAIDGISQSVVIVRKNDEGRQLICAFYTGDEIDSKQIRNIIGKKLPKYMLPHFIEHIDEMPLTSSGKINRKTLPEIDLSNVQNHIDFVAPKNEQQKVLCSLFEKILSINSVGIYDNFFDLGGDSLRAIELVSEAYKESIVFSLQSLFDCPTVKLLDDYIRLENKSFCTYNEDDFTEIHKLLRKTKYSLPTSNEVGDILLTGSTGFLGIHILADYLDNESGTAYCVVRGASKEDSENRLTEMLNYYFNDKYSKELGKRIKAICGDITITDFGIRKLPEFNMIIHAAATVKHYGSFEYFRKINVGGTINAINIAKRQNAKLIHISTLSVSGNSMVDVFDKYHSNEEKTFSEQDLYIGQPLDNVYIRSKFEAEREIYNAVIDGLKANVVRVGNLTNRASDLKFQPNYKSNAFLKRVKAIFELGYMPEYIKNLYCEFSPVDDTAKAIMLIARHFNMNQIVFNASNNKELFFFEIERIAKSLNISLEFLTESDFSSILKKVQSDTKKRYIYEALVNDMDDNGRLVYDTNIHIVKDITINYLRKLGFEWTEINVDYLSRYIDYFKGLGFWEV